MATEKSNRTRVIVGAGIALLSVAFVMIRVALRTDRGLGRLWETQKQIANRSAQSPRPWSSGKFQQSDPAAREQDLAIALESLRKLAEGNDSQPGQRTIFYLNQWISSDPKAGEAWQPDRMLESLPRALRNTPGLERIAKTQFNFDDIEYLQAVQWLDDISYLQQNLWLHDIAERVAREPADARLAPWLKEIESSVGLPEAEQLAKAERLLDWTTRNIQLDPLPPIPKDPLATAGSTETVLPSVRGEVGPGYAHLPLEILLYGHGDAQERARVFILLCRQVGIDVAMLGFPEEQSTVRRGWLPAAGCSVRREPSR